MRKNTILPKAHGLGNLADPVTMAFCTVTHFLPTTMKLHSDDTQQYQTVTGYDASGVEINAQRFNYSLTLLPEVAPRPWDVTNFDDLSAAHFEALAQDAPDVVILGTGARQRFVHPRLVTALSSRHIGVESMDNAAACRTYNVLMGEGRKVTLALILDRTA